MTEPLTDPRTGQTFGDVVPLRSHETSAIEKQVRRFLREAAYPVSKRGVLCHHPDEGKTFLTLTPDIVVEDWRLAVEVDPCSPVRHHGSSHRADVEKDRARNALLEEVGWTVLRLRLGATEGMHIGDRDVVVESSTFTKAAQAALVEALEDFKADREPRVRVVAKGVSPRPAQRRSHVINIGDCQYSDDGHIFNWHPTLDAKKVTLRLCVNGRYLYTHGRTGNFIAEVGLHKVPRDEWRARLTEFLRDHDPASLGTTKWPWGATILDTAPGPVGEDIRERSEHEKHTLDREDFWFTLTGHPAPQWTPKALMSPTGETIAKLRPEARELGYRFANVTLERGRYGLYQRLLISRVGAGN